MYTKKDFIAVAKILRDTKATVLTVEAFVEMFEADNRAFKTEAFRDAVWPDIAVSHADGRRVVARK